MTFFKPLIGNDKERVVIKERHEVTTHGRPQSRKITSVKGKKPSRFGANLWKFIKGFLKVLFVLLIVALIVALVALIGLAIVWALVNFNVITTTQNGFIATSWGIIEKVVCLIWLSSTDDLISLFRMCRQGEMKSPLFDIIVL